MSKAHFPNKSVASADHFFVVTCTGGFLGLAAIAVFVLTSFFS